MKRGGRIGAAGGMGAAGAVVASASSSVSTPMAGKRAPLPFRVASRQSAGFSWLRVLFFLTTKRGCAASCVPHDGRRGIAVATEACRLRAPSRRAVRPSGSPRVPVTKTRVARHENLPASRREREKACAILLEQVGTRQGFLSDAKSAKEVDAKSAKGVDAKNAKASDAKSAEILEAKEFVGKVAWVGSRCRRDRKVEAVSHRFRKDGDLLASAGSSTPPYHSGRVEFCNRERMSVRERGEAFSCNRPTGVTVFVSRSAFVTGARARPNGLARIAPSRPKPLGFEPDDGARRANRACAMPVRPVRGSGVWGRRPHVKRESCHLGLLKNSKTADALAGAL
jgi:hypothetical protein